MLNKVWFWLLCIGILYGLVKSSYQSYQRPSSTTETSRKAAEPGSESTKSTPDNAEAIGLSAMGKSLNGAIVDAAEQSVDLCIKLIGYMALWLGLLHIARDSGLIDAFARLLRPLMRLVFPDVPDGHPAQGAILMNLSANMLGMDNAATPMGLKAMQELQQLNPIKDTATNSMAMFLTVNTSSITLVPFTIIAYRAASGSKNPTEPLLGTLVATLFSTIVAVLITRWMSRWARFQAGTESPSAEISASETGSPEGEG